MDEVQIITQTLNNTLQRHMKAIQSYEVEITNMTAEIVRLQSEVENQKNKCEALETRLANLIEEKQD